VNTQAAHRAPTYAGDSPHSRTDQKTEFGEFLQAARVRRGITLKQISDATKIPLRHLAALERGDVELLPSGMYRRAEVRAYAEAVGLDRKLALERLDGLLDDKEHRVASSAAEPPDSAGRLIGPVLLIGGSLAVAALVTSAIWSGPQKRDRNGPIERAPSRSDRAIESGGHASGGSADNRPTVPVERVSTVPDLPGRNAANVSGRHVERASNISDRPVGHAQTSPDPPGQSTVSAAEPASPLTPAREASVGTGGNEQVRQHVSPAPSAVAGQLVVVSDPPGARVTIDGIGRGVTPLAIAYLPSGSRRLRVTKDGYASQERLVRFVANGPQVTVQIALDKRD
jgi:cytoskeletal protein RodZ